MDIKISGRSIYYDTDSGRRGTNFKGEGEEGKGGKEQTAKYTHVENLNVRGISRK